MNKNRASRKAMRTPEEVARDAKIRTKYQATRPSLDNLEQSGQFTTPVAQGDFLAMMEFAAHIKWLREGMNLSLADLSGRSGVDKAAICRLENGQTDNPTYHTLEKLARALGKRIKIVLEDVPTGAH